MTAIEQFFLVLLFTMLYKVALTFGLWKYNHLNENYVEELPRSPLLHVFLLHSSNCEFTSVLISCFRAFKTSRKTE